MDKRELKRLQKILKIEKVEMRSDDLDYIKLRTKFGLSVKIFEDGLFVLNKNYKNAKEDIKILTSYYEKKLSQAIGYLFSLGAPVPKELANIKMIYPYFFVLDRANDEEINGLLNLFKQEKYFERKEETFEIHRGDKLYIINNKGEEFETLVKLIQEHIYFREFKGQLHRYLNLYRIIWERIAEVKKKGEVKGSEIAAFKSKIEGYDKTVNLIESRINQMGSYIGTRAAIARSDPDLTRIIDLLQFRYDNLKNTLAYIKDLWTVTKNYVGSALKLFSDIQAKNTESSVQNLTVITSMGVGATLIGLFTAKSFPDFTWFGVLYFFILVGIGYSANKIMKKISLRKNYKINEAEIDKNIK